MAMLAAASSVALPALAATPQNAFVMAYNIDAISTFDPAQLAEVVTDEILMNTCDALVNFDPKDEANFIPALAKSWDVSQDGRTITFHLADGIVFADGTPGTAQDLVWSMHRVLSKGFGNASTLTEYGFTKQNMAETITAPDDKTVVLKLDKPYPVNLVMGSIAANRVAVMLNRKLVEANANGDDMGNGWLTSNVACVGPYSMVRWNQGEAVILEANDNYNGPFKPNLKRVMIRHVAEPGTQRLMLENGDIDIARNLNPTDLREIESSDTIQISSALKPSLFYMGMNLSDPIFANEKVRLAMRYLIDYQGLADSVMQGIGVPRASFVQLGAFGALNEQEGQPFKLDPEKAKQILAEAGYPNGFSFTMIIGSHPYADPIVQTIQEAASKAGVTIKVERMSNAQLFAKTRARDFQGALLGYKTSVPDAHGMASRFVANPDNAFEAKLTQYPSWRSAYFNEKDNEAVEAALFERDPAKRAELYHTMQRQMMERGPMAYIMQTMDNAAMLKSVKNWTWNGFRTYYTSATK
ncbi:ABC transporter substrate-binding protein [Brucellaceae bacterium D45D]